MSFPFNFHFNQFEISSHLLFETLAFLFGFRYYLLLRKKETDLLTPEERLWILIAVCIGALFFSRLIAVMEHISLVDENTSLFFYYSQKTIVGGLLGGLIAVEITKKILGIKYSSGDIMTYPLILGIIIGRVGCFFAGLEDGTYGKKTNLPWGVDFGDGILRHPTQIYEIIFLLFLWLCICALERAKMILIFNNKIDLKGKEFELPNGLKFKIFLFAYLFFRFCIEFMKPVSIFYLELSFIQISCLLGIFYYLILLVKYWTKMRRTRNF